MCLFFSPFELDNLELLKVFKEFKYLYSYFHKMVCQILSQECEYKGKSKRNSIIGYG